MFENIFTGYHFIKHAQSITQIKEIIISFLRGIEKYNEPVRK